jgi:hypothetical protein
MLIADIALGDAGADVIPSQFYHLVSHAGGLSKADIRSAFEGAGLQ